MNSFSIKDLENLSGIKAHTLRIWEQRYQFLKPNRTKTNIRKYSTEQLKTILNIALLNKYGFKISQIDKMGLEEIETKILSLTHEEAQFEKVVNELIKQMIDLDMVAFEKTLGANFTKRGVEKTITKIIFEFLQKIGILWITNHINPAQEHLATNLIRQKLILGIEDIKSPLQTNKTVLLFLPESEYHELGLLFMHYLLKKKGINVIYLGCNVPLADVAFVATVKKPDYLYCHITRPGPSFNFDKFLSKISAIIKDTPILISGQITHTYEKKIETPVIFKHSFEEVTDFIHSL